MVWCNGDSHHTIVCEVEKREEVDEVEPEELWSCPLKANHGVHNKSIVCCLNKNEWDLYQHLHSHDSISIVTSLYHNGQRQKITLNFVTMIYL